MKLGLLQTFLAAPLALRAYAVFSVLATVLALAFVIVRPTNLPTAVYSVVGTLPFYGFGLYFTFALIFKTLPRDRFGIIAPLVIQIAGGLFTWYMEKQIAHYRGTPAASPWDLFTTVALPALWIVLLFSPRMNQYVKELRQNFPR